MPDDALVIFLPSGLRGRFARGTPLLEAARKLGVDIDSICGGRGICGRCQVTQSLGNHAKFGIASRPEHLSPISQVELGYVGARPLAPGRRFSCATRLEGDAVIDVPPDSQLHRQIIRKDAETRKIKTDPTIHLYYLEVPAPSLGDGLSEAGRLTSALEEAWNMAPRDIELAALQTLPGALAAEDRKVTVVVWHGERIVAVRPGFHDSAFGLAVDLGTTTIAAHLTDLASGEVVAEAGVMNPQIRFGEDLISRLTFIQQNPGERDTLSQVVRMAVADLAAETARTAGIEVDQIYEASVVGNSIMHHIFLGIDPLSLGRAPFPIVVEGALILPAADLSLGLNPGARVYTLPCIASHVGADTAGVLLAEAPHQSEAMTLIADIGTNAEIVLGNRHRLLACSCPTGPAFEGAQISCGQRAAPGAIERVRIDARTLAPRFKVIGSELWSDEDGFAQSIEDFGITGICGSGIIEAVAEMYLAGIVAPSGLLGGPDLADNPHIEPDGAVHSYCLQAGEPRIEITQTDVRAIQLAKGALYASARLLMDKMGVETPDAIVLAGAFGSRIDAKYAMVLGMIPDCPLDRVRSAGNAAGTGARIALVSKAARAEIEGLTRQVEKVETAAEKDFQRYFVEAMTIPHRTHAYPNLSRVVELPRAPPRQAGRPARSRQDK